MPGPICKHYINSGLDAFAKANAAAVRDAEARGLIKPERAKDLLDRMSMIEVQAYERLRDEVASELAKAGLLSPEVWGMWASAGRIG